MKSSVTMNPKGNLAKLVERLKKLHNQKIEIGYFKEQPLHASGDSYANIMMSHGNGWTIMDLIKFDIESDLLKSNGVFAKELHKLVLNHSMPATLLDDVATTYAHYSNYYFGNSDKLYVTYNPTPMIDTGELSENFAWRTTLTMNIKTIG